MALGTHGAQATLKLLHELDLLDEILPASQKSNVKGPDRRIQRSVQRREKTRPTNNRFAAGPIPAAQRKARPDPLLSSDRARKPLHPPDGAIPPSVHPSTRHGSLSSRTRTHRPSHPESPPRRRGAGRPALTPTAARRCSAGRLSHSRTAARRASRTRPCISSSRAGAAPAADWPRSETVSSAARMPRCRAAVSTSAYSGVSPRRWSRWKWRPGCRTGPTTPRSSDGHRQRPWRRLTARGARRRFGAFFAERLVSALAGGVWAGDARHLSVGACMPFLPEWERRRAPACPPSTAAGASARS